MNPLIVSIKRNALDDGPGIRTVIFFKGCPLSCVWCQNPENVSITQEISFDKSACIGCKQCLAICNLNAIDFSDPNRIKRHICNLCGKCIQACPTNALAFVGLEYSIQQLVEILLQDRIFYKNSGGGVTLSGGEPTIHLKFLSELLNELKRESIHITLETCGFYDQEKFDELILPNLDLIYFDLKFFNPQLHERYCKRPNVKIFRNFEHLIQQKRVEVLPRIPLIPNITATTENLQYLAQYLRDLNISKIGLLPYNPLWLSKVEKIGMTPEYNYEKWLEKDEKERIKQIFSDFSFEDF